MESFTFPNNIYYMFIWKTVHKVFHLVCFLTASFKYTNFTLVLFCALLLMGKCYPVIRCCSVHANLRGSCHCLQACCCLLLSSKLSQASNYHLFSQQGADWSIHILTGHIRIRSELLKMNLWDFKSEISADQLPCKVMFLKNRKNKLF